MHNWFECKVKYDKIDEKSGKDKTVTEAYLMDALSFTEAETRTTAELENVISGEFQVTNISKSKLSDVFIYQEGEWWYKCKVNIIDVDQKSGKEKKSSNMMLIMADNVKEAYERLEESLAELIVPYEIVSIAQSNILDIFPYSVDDENIEQPTTE